jgi:hypothetical protein
MREVGDEVMLLDLATGTYFGLNAVGGRFWQLLEEGKSPVEASEAMLAEFDVAPEVLDHDLEALLDELAAQGLVQADEGGQ